MKLERALRRPLKNDIGRRTGLKEREEEKGIDS